MPTKLPIQKIVKAIDNNLTIGKGFLTGKLKFGTPTQYTVWHQSVKPIDKFKVPFPERWDAVTHGADPNLIWFTKAETPNLTGLMSERPFASQWRFTSQRPLIQTGELRSVLGGKNNTRNAIINFGKRKGADSFVFERISDNRLPITDVIAINERINPEKLAQYERVGDSFISEATGKKLYITPKTEYLQLSPKFSMMSDWSGLEFPELTIYHYGLDGQRAMEPPKFKGILGGGGPPYIELSKPKPQFKMTPNEARHNNLEKLLEKFNGDSDAMWNWLNKNR